MGLSAVGMSEPKVNGGGGGREERNEQRSERFSSYL